MNEHKPATTPHLDFRLGVFMCAWHDAQAAVSDEVGNMMVRRDRTEGRRQQGKGITRNGVSGGSMRQNPCT